jgi:hypothetical protein
MANRARKYERAVRLDHGTTQIAESFADLHGAVVREGPFAGMRYPRERIADIDAAIPKMLGQYEAEIAQVFDDAVRDGTGTFIDIGCADGYFAVGMAHASRRLTTFAYDISSSARSLCRETASLNGVAERVHVGNRFDAGELGKIAPGRSLLLCDIEGGEDRLFDRPEMIPRLSQTTIVVEVHEHLVPGAGDHLRELFASGHDGHVFAQEQRDPTAQRLLAELSAEQATLALAENRPLALHWLVLTPR